MVRFWQRGTGSKPVAVRLPARDEAEIESRTFSRTGVLWATGPGTLYRYDGKNWRGLKVKDGLNGQTMTSLAAPSDDEVWVAYNDVAGGTQATLGPGGVPRCESRGWDQPGVGLDAENRLWFDGTDGHVCLGPEGQMLQ